MTNSSKRDDRLVAITGHSAKRLIQWNDRTQWNLMRWKEKLTIIKLLENRSLPFTPPTANTQTDSCPRRNQLRQSVLKSIKMLIDLICTWTAFGSIYSMGRHSVLKTNRHIYRLTANLIVDAAHERFHKWNAQSGCIWDVVCFFFSRWRCVRADWMRNRCGYGK